MDGPSKTEEARRYVSTLRNEDTTNVLKLLYLTSKLSRLRETDRRGRCPPRPSARWHRPGLSAARSPNEAPLGSGSAPAPCRQPDALAACLSSDSRRNSCSTSTRQSCHGTCPRGRPARDSSAAPSSQP